MRTTPLAAALGLAATVTIAPALTGTTPASAAGETCDGKAATIVVAPATTYPVPWTVGTPGDDVIVGTDERDRIDGGGGNDTICGLDGDDHLVGGAGDDRLFGGLDWYYPDDDYWGDVVEPGPGDDHVDLGADGGWEDIDFVDSVYADQVSYANAAGPVTVDLTTLTATGEGTDTFAATPAGKFTGIVGSRYDDVLTGGPADDQVHGGGGDDRISGGPGDDLLHGDLSWAPDERNSDTSVPGVDVVEGGVGDDVVGGGHGADTLRGDDGDDYLVAAKDARGTSLLGGDGDDGFSTAQDTFARGGAGNDDFELGIGRGMKADEPRTVIGGQGRDKVALSSYVGGKNRYDVTISVPKRRIDVGGGRFAKVASTEEFQVEGNDGPGLIVFRGSDVPELFRLRWVMKAKVHAFGGGGNDVLVSGYAADVLDGGPGRDRLDASRGRDRCLRGESLKGCERRR
ncbi:calcium-binding protein [Microbacterium sp. ARD31]|uniref:calcium-binding protein n=1 Tax=Microbacterium sp. ARD31 TaxID=2962576 RepID=UPI0028829B68|nr:calcium-binding protein [Microbacterium sp. ARD31]MDT0184518.1 calcium-binding protein [Microbacterium sp. ARD31]